MTTTNGMWYSALIGSMTSFNFGINLTLHSISKPIYTKTGESGFTMAENSFDFFISIFAIGALVSNLLTPFIKLTKKRILILIDVLFLIGAILICFAKNTAFLFAGRIIQGFGFGFIGNTVPLYLSNIASADKKGMIGGLHQLFIVTGVLAGQTLGFVFEHSNFRIPYYIYLSILILHMTSLSFVKDVVFEEQGESKSVWDLCTAPGALRSLLLAIFLHVTQQLSCINGIVFFSNTIQPDQKVATRNTFIGGGVLFVSTILSMFFVESFGRKPMLLFSILVDAICLFGVALTPYVLTFLMIFLCWIFFWTGSNCLVHFS